MVLKPSWEVLGAVDGPEPTKRKIGGGHKSIFGPSWVPKREPKRTPRRPKIDQKIVLKNDRVLDRS